MDHSEQGIIRIMLYRVPYKEETILTFIGEALATVYVPMRDGTNDFEKLLENI